MKMLLVLLVAAEVMKTPSAQPVSNPFSLATQRPATRPVWFSGPEGKGNPFGEETAIKSRQGVKTALMSTSAKRRKKAAEGKAITDLLSKITAPQ